MEGDRGFEPPRLHARLSYEHHGDGSRVGRWRNLVPFLAKVDVAPSVFSRLDDWGLGASDRPRAPAGSASVRSVHASQGS
jgi:hypothetical protein